MPIVRLKASGSLSDHLRSQLSRILNENNISLLRLHSSYDGYVAQVAMEDDVNKIFEDNTKTALRTINCQPVLSPEKRAKLTLVLKGIDRSITDLPPETIAAEIERTTTHAKVDDMYVMQKYLIKVRFNSPTSASLIREKGLKMLAFSVTPSQIEAEKFTAITQCMHCKQLP